MGAAGVVLTSDRDVSYSTIENALHEQGFLDGYLIYIRPARDQLMISIQTISDTFVPASGEEVPTLEVHMYSGRRTGVAYDGRTLEGLVSHDTKLRY